MTSGGLRLGRFEQPVWRSQVEWSERRFTFLKTKNRRDHVLPLTGMVQEILKRRLPISNSSRVFGTEVTGWRLGNVDGAVRRLRKATGVYFTPHDLRRWTATALEQAGVGVYTIKGVLNHRSGCRVKLGCVQQESGKIEELEGGIVGTDPTMRYIQVSLEMKRWALEKIEEILSGKHHGGGPSGAATDRVIRRQKYLPGSPGVVVQAVEIDTLDRAVAYTVPTRDGHVEDTGAVNCFFYGSRVGIEERSKSQTLLQFFRTEGAATPNSIPMNLRCAEHG